MIISFEVRNFKSINDQITISFVANNYNDSTQYEPYFSFGKQNILKGIGLFGANASGKSNVLEAMNAFARTIVQTTNFSEHQENTAIIPFAFNESKEEKPTTFGLKFILNGIKYEYSISLTRRKIIEESLSFSPNGRIVSLLKKNGSDLILNERYFDQDINKLIKERNIPNKPIVTFAAQFNIRYLRDVYSYVHDKFTFTNGLYNAYEQGIGNLIDKSSEYQNFLVSLMKAADLSIDDVNIVKTKNPISVFPVSENLQNTIYKVYTTHTVKGKSYPFGLESESLGTLKLMAFSSSLFHALKNGMIVVFDEFGSSLHPDLTKFMLSLFFDSNINQNRAQILFATHDTHLLNEMILRRDEIYVVEKDKQSKETKVYPLSDFSVRKTENIENGFLNGRYINPPDIDSGDLKI